MTIIQIIFLSLLIIWGIPSFQFRTKFRKIVYQTDSWKISFAPRFVKETVALFGKIYPENKEYIRVRNFYRFYLSVYLLLFLTYYFLFRH